MSMFRKPVRPRRVESRAGQGAQTARDVLQHRGDCGVAARFTIKAPSHAEVVSRFCRFAAGARG